MTTIKGPLIIKMGHFGKVIQEAIDKGEVNISLPFTATGWKSIHNSGLVEGGVVLEETTEPKEIKKEPIIVEGPVVIEPKLEVPVISVLSVDEDKSTKRRKGRPKRTIR